MVSNACVARAPSRILRRDYLFSGDARLPRTRDARDAERTLKNSLKERLDVSEEAGHVVAGFSSAKRSG